MCLSILVNVCNGMNISNGIDKDADGDVKWLLFDASCVVRRRVCMYTLCLKWRHSARRRRSDEGLSSFWTCLESIFAQLPGGWFDVSLLLRSIYLSFSLELSSLPLSGISSSLSLSGSLLVFFSSFSRMGRSVLSSMSSPLPVTETRTRDELFLMKRQRGNPWFLSPSVLVRVRVATSHCSLTPPLLLLQPTYVLSLLSSSLSRYFSSVFASPPLCLPESRKKEPLSSPQRKEEETTAVVFDLR